MGFDPNKPYNDLPGLPPKAELETRAVMRKVVSAGRALAELKGIGQAIPNQAMLVDSIVLQEARASSEVENIVTTDDKLFRAFTAKTGKIDPATKEVLRYREALWRGHDALGRRNLLTTNLFINIVQCIKLNTAGIRKEPGVTISNKDTGEIIYTPPEGESVIRDKLRNLEEFIHADDGIDPLVKLPLVHYQFEAVHPFADGNGRTGRIINILFLVQKGLLDLPVLYLSKDIIERKNDYYRLLRDVTESGAWEPWILYLLDAVENTASLTRKKIMDIRALILETMEQAKRELPKRVYSKELIELLFRQPYSKIAFLVDENIASRNIASNYLNELVKIGILQKGQLGKEIVYLNVKLYDLLSS